MKGRYITKPLLMPLLGLYYLTSAFQMNYLFLAAITCAWMGDIFLMMAQPCKRNHYFKLGLLAFLTGNILYMVVFAKYFPCLTSMPAWGWGFISIYIAAGIVACRLLVPYAGRMMPAVIVYIVVIVLTGSSTLIPLGCVHPIGAVTAMAGVFLFMLSDGINAYHRFIGEVPMEWMMVMGPYLLGQFLIVQGYLLF